MKIILAVVWLAAFVAATGAADAHETCDLESNEPFDWIGTRLIEDSQFWADEIEIEDGTIYYQQGASDSEYVFRIRDGVRVTCARYEVWNRRRESLLIIRRAEDRIEYAYAEFNEAIPVIHIGTDGEVID